MARKAQKLRKPVAYVRGSGATNAIYVDYGFKKPLPEETLAWRGKKKEMGDRKRDDKNRGRAPRGGNRRWKVRRLTTVDFHGKSVLKPL